MLQGCFVPGKEDETSVRHFPCDRGIPKAHLLTLNSLLELLAQGFHPIWAIIRVPNLHRTTFPRGPASQHVAAVGQAALRCTTCHHPPLAPACAEDNTLSAAVSFSLSLKYRGLRNPWMGNKKFSSFHPRYRCMTRYYAKSRRGKASIHHKPVILHLTGITSSSTENQQQADTSTSLTLPYEARLLRSICHLIS